MVRTGPARPTDAARPAAGSTPAASGAETLDEAATWELISDVTDDMDRDAVSAAGLAPAPGTGDPAALQLSTAERAELGKLLAREIAGLTSRRAAGGRS